MKKVALLIAAVIVVAIIVIIASPHKSSKESATSTTTPPAGTSDQTATPPAAATSSKTMTYKDDSFSSVSLAAGDTLTVKNDSDTVLDFASDPHPSHTDYPELNLGPIQPGESKSVTVTKKGTWGVHNHRRPGDRGQLTVS